jgi:glycosyltransferase involved in cell wall biosynthesis
MQILMLVQSPNIYGSLPKLTPLLIESLQSLGCEVHTSVWGRHNEQENLLDKIIGRMRDLLRVRKRLKTRKFDMMVVQTSHDWPTLCRDIPLVLVTRQLCAHIVLQMHGSKADLLIAKGNGIFKAATRWLLQWVDAILVLSTEEQSQFQQFYPHGRFYVVDNPFMPSNEDSSVGKDISWEFPADCPVLLFVGRLIVEKGVYDLLESMPIILRQINCHLLISGDGPEKEGLQREIHELGILQHVTLLGYLTGQRLSSVYRRANIFILPSYSEGFPTVITEAMSFGLPIVTTTIRGVADHLQEGVNALFIHPRDPLSLAVAILKLLNEPDLRAGMKIANYEKVKQFEPAVVGEKYFHILRGILAVQGIENE